MQRPSQQDADGIVFQTVALPVGGRGIDLRRADDPGTLTELLNARFLDEGTVTRRDGHTSRLVQARRGFEHESRPTDEWVYGHGAIVVPNENDEWEDLFYPIQTRGGGTFKFGDSDVVWTGDRLLVMTAEGPSYGGDTHWDRSGTNERPTYFGIEAYLPVQTDEVHPAAVTQTFVDMCLTERWRVVAESGEDETRVWVFDRETGQLYSETAVQDTDTTVGLRVVNSGEVPLLFYLREDEELYLTSFNGNIWSTPDVVNSDVDAFDVVPVEGGAMLAWREGDGIFCGHFVGGTDVGTPFVFGSQVTTTATTPNGIVTLAVSGAGDLAFVFQILAADGHDELALSQMTSAMEAASDVVTLTDDDEHAVWMATACFRGLRNDFGRHALVIYGCLETGGSWLTRSWEYRPDDEQPSFTFHEVYEGVRYNSALVSQAFKVGDEVFVHLQSQNSTTNFLVAGARFRVVGISDREEGVPIEPIETDDGGA